MLRERMAFALAVIACAAGALYGRDQEGGQLSFCRTDEMLEESLRADPALRHTMDALEQAIAAKLSERSGDGEVRASATSASYVVPVVVYVVHQAGVPVGTDENISEQQVNSQIAALNMAFAGRGITFCLATKGPSGPLPGFPTPGIIRIASSLTKHLTTQEAMLKALSPLPCDRYLRIWVVKDIDNGSGVAGYARFPGTPSSLDGVVMRADVFGSVTTCGCSLLPKNDRGQILVHEVGHYLGLFHTFQAGCAGSTSLDCATAGDKLCDTPQIAVATSGCPTGMVMACDGSEALIRNEMDYTNDLCRDSFTPGQEARMLATLAVARSTLVSPANLALTGVQCAGALNAGFFADPWSACAGAAVAFQDPVVTSSAGYNWSFGDGSTGSGASVTHSYATGGTYTVTLTVNGGATSVSSSQQIFVANCAPIASSQGNWFFGRYGELHFATGVPQAANAALAAQSINSSETAVSQSDAAGNLLFYSDGRLVWNNQHAQASGVLLHGFTSATQAIAVPDPGDPKPADPHSFYLITVPGLSSGNETLGAFEYTKISAAGNILTVTAMNTPMPRPPNSDARVGEMITAVPGCGSNDWVIVHGFYTDPQYSHALFVYPLTPAGFGSPAVYPLAGPARLGYLKASPDGTKLAYGTGDSQSADSTDSGTTRLFDFDRSTGVPSNPRVIKRYAYGVSFSPSSRLLYLTETLATQKLYQYDGGAADVDASERTVGEVPSGYSALQLGPDRKIYVALNDSNHLAVIHDPDQRITGNDAAACGYSPNGPWLNVPSSATAVKVGYGLPNMIDAQRIAVAPAFTATIPSCNKVDFAAPSCAASYAWSFGDGETGSAQTLSHKYAANGTYTVTLTMNGSITASRQIRIGLPASATVIAGPARVCAKGATTAPFYNYSANAQSGLRYQWAVTGGTITGLTGNDNVDVSWKALPGTVQLTVTDAATGCTATSTMTVTELCASTTCTPRPELMTAWWPFDESCGAMADDIGGFVDNAGTLMHGPTPAAGMVGNALSFDGVDDFVEVADHPELEFAGGCDSGHADAMSIDLWLRTDIVPGAGPASGLLTILDKRVNPSRHPSGYHLYLFNGRAGFQVDGANSIAPASGPDYVNVADNQWHFVGVSVGTCFEGGFLYVDGRRVLDLPPASGFVNTAKLYIGARDPAFGSNYFKGLIDELEIFRTPLSEGVFDALYAAGSKGTCKVDCSLKSMEIAPDLFELQAANFTAGIPSVTLTASGGNPPYTFAVTGGTLPQGMVLTPDGILFGFLYDFPRPGGTFGFAVTAIDADGCRTSRNYSVTVPTRRFFAAAASKQ